MRVLLASDVFPPHCGGSGWSTYYLAEGLRKRGHEVRVVVPVPPGGVDRRAGPVELIGFPFRPLDLPFLRAVVKGPAFYPRLAGFLDRVIEEWKPDVLHGQHSMTVPPSVAAAHRRRIPAIGTVRDFWPVCLFGTMTRRDGVCPGCSVPRAAGCLAERHGAAGLLGFPLLAFLAADLRYKRRCLAASDRVIAVSGYVKRSLHGVVTAERLVVVPNAVDLQRIEEIVSSPAATAPPGPYLLFVGKLEPNKGAGFLLPALERLGIPIPLVVAGDGGMRPALEERARASNLDVRFAGWVDNEEVLRLMAGAHLLLFPAVWPEPLSRVLLEAMAVGAPVVAMDTGGTTDIIQNGGSGLLSRSLEEFVDQATLALADDQLRAAISNGARRVAEERFSTGIVASQVESIYEETLRECADRRSE